MISHNTRSQSAPAPVPTWAYHPVLGARVFELSPGRKLPAGWADVPHAGQHPHDADMPCAPSAAGEDRDVAAPARRDEGRGRKRRATDIVGEIAPPVCVELRAPQRARNARMARHRKDGGRNVRAGREKG